MFSSARQRDEHVGPRIGRDAQRRRTSELPEFPEAARLPCLTTGTPQAATTIAAAVEIFTVPAPSPPVPQVSSRRSGAIPLSQRDHPARGPPGRPLPARRPSRP